MTNPEVIAYTLKVCFDFDGSKFLCQFLRRQNAKNASNGQKTLQKRLLRRLALG